MNEKIQRANRRFRVFDFFVQARHRHQSVVRVTCARRDQVRALIRVDHLDVFVSGSSFCGFVVELSLEFLRMEISLFCFLKRGILCREDGGRKQSKRSQQYRGRFEG